MGVKIVFINLVLSLSHFHELSIKTYAARQSQVHEISRHVGASSDASARRPPLPNPERRRTQRHGVSVSHFRTHQIRPIEPSRSLRARRVGEMSTANSRSVWPANAAGSVLPLCFPRAAFIAISAAPQSIGYLRLAATLKADTGLAEPHLSPDIWNLVAACLKRKDGIPVCLGLRRQADRTDRNVCITPSWDHREETQKSSLPIAVTRAGLDAPPAERPIQSVPLTGATGRRRSGGRVSINALGPSVCFFRTNAS